MTLIRHRKEAASPERAERRPFDWPFNPESWRRMLQGEEVKVDEYVEDGQLVVRAELPGVDPDRDIDVSISNGALCIRAERRHEEKEERRNYRRSEIRYGSFARVLPLPPNAKESDITASYTDGVLEVRAPVDEAESGASRIPISRS